VTRSNANNILSPHHYRNWRTLGNRKLRRLIFSGTSFKYSLSETKRTRESPRDVTGSLQNVAPGPVTSPSTCDMNISGYVYQRKHADTLISHTLTGGSARTQATGSLSRHACKGRVSWSRQSTDEKWTQWNRICIIKGCRFPLNLRTRLLPSTNMNCTGASTIDSDLAGTGVRVAIYVQFALFGTCDRTLLNVSIPPSTLYGYSVAVEKIPTCSWECVLELHSYEVRSIMHPFSTVQTPPSCQLWLNSGCSGQITRWKSLATWRHSWLGLLLSWLIFFTHSAMCNAV
jgi:hypothetical protein